MQCSDFSAFGKISAIFFIHLCETTDYSGSLQIKGSQKQNREYFQQTQRADVGASELLSNRLMQEYPYSVIVGESVHVPEHPSMPDKKGMKEH